MKLNGKGCQDVELIHLDRDARSNEPSVSRKCQRFFHYLRRVLLEKLTGFQLVKKLPAFYGTQRFITAFTLAEANTDHRFATLLCSFYVLLIVHFSNI